MPTWSPSSLAKYETCPKQFYEVKIAKNFVEPPTEHTIWGVEVHQALELAVKESKPLEGRFEQYQWVKDKIDSISGVKAAELKLAITREKRACSFSDPDAWTRCILDLAVVKGRSAVVIDYKTGKKKDNDRQLKQNALVLLHNIPNLKTVYTAYLWLQTRQVTKATYHREDMPRLWATFDQALDEMEFSFKNDVWPAKQSGLCRAYCAVVSCMYNGKR